MNHLKQILLKVILLVMPFAFTSCEELFGEWEKPTPYIQAPEFNALLTPLTLEAVSGNITVTIQTPLAEGKTVEYSVDDGISWISATAKGDGAGNYIDVISITGKKILFHGNNDSYFSVSLKSDADCYIYGNIMSLIFGADYIGKKVLDKTKNKRAFCRLFSHNPFLKSHEIKDLVLPATSLSPGCYQEMFVECTGLTRAPALPATDLSGCEECYMDMFEGCRSLKEAPELPATKLSVHCYSGMFHYCDNLINAPALPATDLTDCDYCYSHMFFHCKSLKYAPELPSMRLAKECYYSMFCGCPELETAPDLPATQLAEACYDTMFSSCKKLTVAPLLPAKTLVKSCYNMMFNYCDKLGSVTCLATSGFDTTNCLSFWLNNAGSDASITSRTLNVKTGHAGEAWNVPTGTYAWNIVDNQ